MINSDPWFRNTNLTHFISKTFRLGVESLLYPSPHFHRLLLGLGISLVFNAMKKALLHWHKHLHFTVTSTGTRVFVFSNSIARILPVSLSLFHY